MKQEVQLVYLESFRPVLCQKEKKKLKMLPLGGRLSCGKILLTVQVIPSFPQGYLCLPEQCSHSAWQCQVSDL